MTTSNIGLVEIGDIGAVFITDTSSLSTFSGFKTIYWSNKINSPTKNQGTTVHLSATEGVIGTEKSFAFNPNRFSVTVSASFVGSVSGSTYSIFDQVVSSGQTFTIPGSSSLTVKADYDGAAGFGTQDLVLSGSNIGFCKYRTTIYAGPVPPPTEPPLPPPPPTPTSTPTSSASSEFRVSHFDVMGISYEGGTPIITGMYTSTAGDLLISGTFHSTWTNGGYFEIFDGTSSIYYENISASATSYSHTLSGLVTGQTLTLHFRPSGSSPVPHIIQTDVVYTGLLGNASGRALTWSGNGLRVRWFNPLINSTIRYRAYDVDYLREIYSTNDVTQYDSYFNNSQWGSQVNVGGVTTINNGSQVEAFAKYYGTSPGIFRNTLIETIDPPPPPPPPPPPTPTPLSWILTVVNTGEGVASTYGTGTHHDGALVNVGANFSAGYEFSHWTGPNTFNLQDGGVNKLTTHPNRMLIPSSNVSITPVAKLSPTTFQFSYISGTGNTHVPATDNKLNVRVKPNATTNVSVYFDVSSATVFPITASFINETTSDVLFTTSFSAGSVKTLTQNINGLVANQIYSARVEGPKVNTLTPAFASITRVSGGRFKYGSTMCMITREKVATMVVSGITTGVPYQYNIRNAQTGLNYDSGTVIQQASDGGSRTLNTNDRFAFPSNPPLPSPPILGNIGFLEIMEPSPATLTHPTAYYTGIFQAFVPWFYYEGEGSVNFDVWTERPDGGLVYCIVNGGVGPYSYNWSLSYGQNVNVNAQGSPVTRFHILASGYPTTTYTFYHCTVTDSLGNQVQTNEFEVSLRSVYPGGGGGGGGENTISLN